jgi:diguanylate cyclase (GGDEF)-like protein
MDTPQQQQFAVNLMEHLVTATFVLDREGKVIIWNRACERLTGIMAQEVIGTSDHWQAFYDKQRMCLADVLVQNRAEELDDLYVFHAKPSLYGNGFRAENWCVMPRLEKRLYIAFDAGPIYDSLGNLIAVVETLRDMTDYKKAQEALEHMAIIDDMTGLSNRRYFDERLNAEWSHARRSHQPLSLIMLDVDFFKQFNDTYGHQAGDECLKSVAEVLQRSLSRSTDMAARYGGEEFCILLPDTDLDGAFKIAERVRLNIATMQIPHAASSVSKWVTLSTGISSLIPTMRDESSQLILQADEALYEAKGRGRNQSVKSATKQL